MREKDLHSSLLAFSRNVLEFHKTGKLDEFVEELIKLKERKIKAYIEDLDRKYGEVLIGQIGE